MISFQQRDKSSVALLLKNLYINGAQQKIFFVKLHVYLIYIIIEIKTKVYHKTTNL